MKFACGNCLNCCVTVSAEVQYCGTAAECSPESLPLGLAAFLAVAALAVLGVGLFLLYYLWRDRRLGADRQQPTQNEQLREEVVKTEREKEGKAEGGVGRATTFRERRSNKLPKKQT